MRIRQGYRCPTSGLNKTTATNPERVGELVNLFTQLQTIDLTRELDRIIDARPAPPINFRAWLEAPSVNTAEFNLEHKLKLELRTDFN